MSWFNNYKNIGDGNPWNVAENIHINEEDINIPLNLPTFIVGSKNAGKSTLISTLIKASSENQIYTRIIYIYSDHVDSTLAEQCHVSLIRVPLNASIKFLTEYFTIKTEYMSWVKFLEKNEDVIATGIYKLETLLSNYQDNIIDNYIRNSLNANKTNKQQNKEIQGYRSPSSKIVSFAESFIEKYSQEFEIVIDDISYYIEGLRYYQYDQLILDDVGVSSEYLFPTNINKSPLYHFLTISRHILLGTIIAGQDTLQLPKYARKEINTYIFGVGVAIADIDKTNIPKNKQKEIIKLYQTLKQYDFIIYNGLNNSISTIINN
jgi:hypothetical protein